MNDESCTVLRAAAQYGIAYLELQEQHRRGQWPTAP